MPALPCSSEGPLCFQAAKGAEEGSKGSFSATDSLPAQRPEAESRRAG